MSKEPVSERELEEYWSEIYTEVEFLQQRFELPAPMAWAFVLMDQLSNALHRIGNTLESPDQDEPWKS